MRLILLGFAPVIDIRTGKLAVSRKMVFVSSTLIVRLANITGNHAVRTGG